MIRAKTFVFEKRNIIRPVDFGVIIFVVDNQEFL